MPFTRMDVDIFDEIVDELDPEDLPPDMAENRPSGEFEYQAASARFVREELGPVSRVMLEVLTAAGATGFRVRYNGGYDEGFAYSDAILFGTESRAAEEVARDLATPELADRIREAAARESRWGDPAELYAGASPVEVTASALEDLGSELATQLLGNGFGTGEYQLYGAFTADLRTGDLIDDPNAAKPEQME